MLDLAKTKRQTQVLKLIVATQAMARPFTAPPGIPADRMTALATAFDETMKDPAFNAEAKKLGLDVSPMTGAQKIVLPGIGHSGLLTAPEAWDAVRSALVEPSRSS